MSKEVTALIPKNTVETEDNFVEIPKSKTLDGLRLLHTQEQNRKFIKSKPSLTHQHSSLQQTKKC